MAKISNLITAVSSKEVRRNNIRKRSSKIDIHKFQDRKNKRTDVCEPFLMT